jgi:hypothetical protein
MTKDIKAAALFGIGFVLGVAAGNWLLTVVKRNT